MSLQVLAEAGPDVDEIDVGPDGTWVPSSRSERIKRQRTSHGASQASQGASQAGGSQEARWRRDPAPPPGPKRTAARPPRIAG